MPRTCDCAGPCGPGDNERDDSGNGLSRRGFLTLLGTSSAAAAIASAAPPVAGQQPEAPPRQSLEDWKRTLFSGRGGAAAATARRVYRSGEHTDVRFPLGGIGTGSFELGVDGQFTVWQLWNTLRDGHLPFFFGVRTSGGAAKLLQTAGGPPGLPKVAGIEMVGEYPLATLRYRDPDLPVRVAMTAFTPFSPFDTDLSSLPVACFAFRLENPTQEQQTVSLAGFLQNPVGYDALGPAISFNSVGFNTVPPRWGNRHPNFGGNRNRPVDAGGCTGIAFTAEAGRRAEVAGGKPFRLFTNANPGGLNTYPLDHAPGFRVASLDALPASVEEPASTVIWIENAPVTLSAQTLRHTRDAVNRGATVVWAGGESPLLTLYARAPDGAASAPPDILFADFENGYGAWKVEGEAFGDAPATGTLPGQQPVTGFMGKGLVNTFWKGDDTTGRLTSPTFTVERRFIRFLIGGGWHPNTQLRLIVDGQPVRRESGRNEERLFPVIWDVSEFKGKTAHLEIVDDQKGPWGHVNVDHIEFSDVPVAKEVFDLLAELVPARFKVPAEGAPPGQAVLFAGATPAAGAAPVAPASGAATDGVKFLAGKLGAGRTVLASGSLLAWGDAELFGARQRAFAELARVAGIAYTPARGVAKGAPGFGSVALGVSGGDRRSRLAAFDRWQDAWAEFARTGALPERGVSSAPTPTPVGQTVNGAVAASVTLAPGQSKEVSFVLAWHFPNRYYGPQKAVGNHYATRWPDAAAVLRDAARDLPKLRERTERFRTAFYDSTLPYWMLDCLTSQISTIRHPGVVFRIADGNVYGWEGSNGCCPPTCTHVWGYEQALAYLFPDLERRMRSVDFDCQQGPDGGVNNRTEVPAIPGRPTGERPFSDGHASGILKFYREVRNQSDPAYLKERWPKVRAAVDYLIAQDAASSPDGKPDGTLSGDQWNTYDNAIHGVNSFIGTYYLAALRAGEEMARRVGDNDAVERFRGVFQKGRENLLARCWNGEYFQQDLPGYENRTGEYGPGCLSDQLIGQWWAHQLGLGYLLPQDHVRKALRAVFRHNWRTDFTDFQHHWRKFAGGTDKGLLNCTWPRGGRPTDTIPYVDEVWTGVEYQVAGHLLYEGMVEEAFCIVKGVRDRYDGVPRAPMPRNPWNEIECGGHYARALANWSLLLALTGWDYDGVERVLRLTPPPAEAMDGGKFRAFWSGPAAWGIMERESDGGAGGPVRQVTLRVVEGRFPAARIELGGIREAENVQAVTVTRSGKQGAVPYTELRNGDISALSFAPALTLSAGQALTLTVGPPSAGA